MLHSDAAMTPVEFQNDPTILNTNHEALRLEEKADRFLGQNGAITLDMSYSSSRRFLQNSLFVLPLVVTSQHSTPFSYAQLQT